MTGIMKDPMAAVSAAPAPVMPEEKSMATRVTKLRPPLILPTSILEKFTIRGVIPQASIKFPAKMKRGTEIRRNELRPTNILWGIRTKGRSACRIDAVPLIPRTNTMGTPVINKKMKIRTMSISISPSFANEAWYLQVR
jgi:hypothetical protein